MSDIKTVYAASTAITITLNSLANAAARESTAIDNSTNLYLDALVRVSVSIGTVANPKQVRIYVYGSEDGTTYEDPCTGSDAAITLEDPPVTRQARTIEVPTSTKVYEAIFSVAAVFGMNLPKKWGIIVENQSGAAFAGSNCSAAYTGIYQTVI